MSCLKDSAGLDANDYTTIEETGQEVGESGVIKLSTIHGNGNSDIIILLSL